MPENDKQSDPQTDAQTAPQPPGDHPEEDAAEDERAPGSAAGDDWNPRDPDEDAPKPTWIPTVIVALLALFFGSVAIARAVFHPRTDDAEVFANFIGMAPQVDGPIMQLPIRDNQVVKQGDLLFVIDERPYQYALERALSDQAALEGQIEDRQRYINSQVSAVRVAAATVTSSAANRTATAATIPEANADVASARAAVLRGQADLHYAEDNLHRLEPLLAQQFVTVDQVDQARTQVEVRTRAVEQAEAQVALAEARVASNTSRYQQSAADEEQRRAQREQAANAVETLAPLTNQREQRAAAVRLARYNLNNCRVYAPFDGMVTDLTTSQGAYVHTGSQVFTMIDARAWWVIANFRETQLKHVIVGSAVDVFLMQHEDTPLHGVVESIGYGVTPDPSVAGVITPGLPAVQRSLSWVHLAARYPVRIRILSMPPGLLRIGETAVAVVHPSGSGRPWLWAR